jgi:hypothetical protein
MRVGVRGLRVRIRVMVMPVVSPSIFTSEADLFASEAESVVFVSVFVSVFGAAYGLLPVDKFVFGAAGGLLPVDTFVFGAAGGLVPADRFCRNAMVYVFGIREREGEKSLV